MKKIYILLYLISFPALAQDVTTEVDYQLQLLDKNFITTDILYDRIFPLSNLVEFNQSTIDTSNANHFFQAYYELQKADYISRWPSLTSFKTILENQEPNIPIGIINVDFEYLDEEAITDNLLDIQGTDSLLIDVPGRSRSPYLKKQSLVISTLKTYSNSKNVTFELNSSFNLNSSSKNIQSIYADFDNGQGYQTLPISGLKTISFTDIGVHNIKFKITFSDSSIKYTYSQIEINSSPKITKISYNLTKSRTQTEFCTHDTITSNITFQGYDESQSYPGTGEFEVFKGGTKLDRPVIVLDGFDPFEGKKDGVDTQDIYSEFLFFNGLNLGTQLRAEDFDIIPLNFLKTEADNGKIINGGTDYIERNAMVLVELISRINTSTCWETNMEPIKVIGFSMGGLIARYALRYMEQNNIPHNTDLFVSVDSPHNGAVVPMGVQQLVDFVDDVANIDDADEILRSPAARQMLIHHYLSNSKSPAGAPNFHDNFYTTLNQMGFPQLTRNISVVNGTSNGSAINSPNSEYFDGSLEVSPIIPTTALRAQAKMNFSSVEGQTNKVFDFKLKLRLIAFYITIYKRYSEVTSSTLYGSLENSPGGFFSVDDEIQQFLGQTGTSVDISSDFMLGLITQTKLDIATPQFSFIPAKSALAFNGGNQFLYEDFSSRNLVCTGETPFDSYFTSIDDNQEHITLDQDKAEFIFDEIMGLERQPNVQLDVNEAINGPSIVCAGGSTFNVDACDVKIVDWQVSSNLIVLNSDDYSITVEPEYSTSRGDGFITATTATGSQSTKNFHVGKPYAFLPNSPTICTNQFIQSETYYLPSSDGALSYRLKSNSPYLTIDGMSEITYTSAPVQITFMASRAGSFLVELFTENNCGESRGAIYVTAENCSGGPGGFESFSVSPNPATTEINVKEKDKDNSGKSNHLNKKAYGKLYNFSGEFIKAFSLKSNRNTPINVSKLRSGFYILQIFMENEKIETHTIVIK